jgi:hypothetical protein
VGRLTRGEKHYDRSAYNGQDNRIGFRMGLRPHRDHFYALPLPSVRNTVLDNALSQWLDGTRIGWRGDRHLSDPDDDALRDGAGRSAQNR